MKKIIFVLFVLVLIPVTLMGQTIMGFDDANPPFSVLGKTGAEGIYPVLIKEAFSRMKEPVTLVAQPWKRVINGIDTGELGAADIFTNAERLLKYDFSKSMYDERLVLYVLLGKEFKYTKVSDLYGKTVGIRAGWSYGDEFNAAVKAGNIKAEEAASDDVNLKKLAASRVDIIIATPEGADGFVVKLGYTGTIKSLPTSFSSVTGHIAFNKSAKKTDLLKKFDAAIESMKKDGTYEKLVSAELIK